MIKVVLLGGGSGGYAAAKSLSHIEGLSITMITPSTDNGGSSRRVMDENGMPIPPGDAAQALLALATVRGGLLDLMPLRLVENSANANHSLINLAITAKTQDLGGGIEAYKQALVDVGNLLGVRGRVLPISCRTKLGIERQDGTLYLDEDVIDEQSQLTKWGQLPPIVRVFHEPTVHIDHDAASAIIEADVIIICGGSSTTSIKTLLVTEGAAQALASSGADIIDISNLVNEANHSDRYTAHDYARDHGKIIYPAKIRVLLANIGRPSPTVLALYEEEFKNYVELGEPDSDATYITVTADMLAATAFKQSPKDSVKRSIIRHDTYLLQAELIRIMRMLGIY